MADKLKRNDSKNEQVTDLQRQYVEVIKTNCDGIGRLAGFTKLTKLHHDWIFKMLTKNGVWVLQAHRGSYKSSSLVIAMALMIVLYPNKSILFMRKTDEDVKEIVAKVSKVLKTDIFTRLANVFHKTGFTFLRDTAFEITTSLKTDIGNGKAQLFAMGSKGSLTGKHADIIIVDDIITKVDMESKVERDRVKGIWYELESNIKNPDGRIVSIGTPWHVDDAFTLMPEPEKYTCYETGLLTDKQIEDLKAKNPPRLFSANYELKHVADGERLFTEPKRTKDFEKIYDGICHVDAGYGGGDYTAFTIMKKVNEVQYICFARRWQKHVDLCMDEIIKLKNKYRAGTLYLETNGDKGYLLKEFRKKNIICSGYHEHTNKYTKISSELFRIWKYIEFIPETDEDCIGEALDYTENADHDDFCDSAANLARVLNRGHVKSISGLKI